ncbi:winged helix-turn-helix domain-containing protein [Chloroflexi bacterium TSY]|nr:winged helix-turn-helix domain-containing protein [Chloroflexi bacterium TSY]
MAESESVENELHLLEALDGTPETTQANLAVQVGVAVGTVNWYLKRWSAKGYVKIKRIDRWRWRYLLTPQGIAHKAVLARKYVDASMKLYRRTRAEARRLLAQVQEAGYDQVIIEGDGEIAEICQLTCLELSIAYVNNALNEEHLPVLREQGTNVALFIPDERCD